MWLPLYSVFALACLTSAASFQSIDKKGLLAKLEAELKNHHLPNCASASPHDWCSYLELYLEKIQDIGTASAFADMGDMIEQVGKAVSWNGVFARALWLRSMSFWNFKDVSDCAMFARSVEEEGPVLVKDAVDFFKGSVNHLFKPYTEKRGLVDFPKEVADAFNLISGEEEKIPVREFLLILLSDRRKNHWRITRLGIELNQPIAAIQCQLLCLLHILPKDAVLKRLEPVSPIVRVPTPLPTFVPGFSTLEALEQFCLAHGLDFYSWIKKDASTATNAMYKLWKQTGTVDEKLLDLVFNQFFWDRKAAFDAFVGESRADFLVKICANWRDHLPKYLDSIDLQVKIKLMRRFSHRSLCIRLPSEMPPIYQLIPSLSSKKPLNATYLKQLVLTYSADELISEMREWNKVSANFYSEDCMAQVKELA